MRDHDRQGDDHGAEMAEPNYARPTIAKHPLRWLLAGGAVAALLYVASALAGWTSTAPRRVASADLENQPHTGPAYGTWQTPTLPPAAATQLARNPNDPFLLGAPLGPLPENMHSRPVATAAERQAAPAATATPPIEADPEITEVNAGTGPNESVPATAPPPSHTPQPPPANPTRTGAPPQPSHTANPPTSVPPTPTNPPPTRTPIIGLPTLAPLPTLALPTLLPPPATNTNPPPTSTSPPPTGTNPPPPTNTPILVLPTLPLPLPTLPPLSTLLPLPLPTLPLPLP